MAKKKSVHNTYCFSERLQAQLAKISESFLTVVEAPSGFGKTTAIREYLAAIRKGGVGIKWHTCLGESPARAWEGICGLFSEADGATAQELRALGVPTLETLSGITALLSGFRCPKTRYAIIDNFQLFKISVQKKFITALSACQVNNLHIIVITQPLDDVEATHLGAPCHTITAQDLVFDNACITKFCRLTGIAITSKEIHHIQAVSEGWVAAIRLQLKHYAESGSLMNAGGVNSLVETAVWNKLSARERDFMLAASLLDGFTAQQVAIMGGKDAMPKNVMKLLSLEFFIRRVADKNVYAMHGILRDYLAERFALQPQDAIDAMHRKAASACLVVSDYFQAAQLFLRVSDYDAILSMPFTDQYFFNNQERDIIQFFARLFQECPPSILLKHPLTLVTVGIQFFKKGMGEQYVRVVELMEDFFKNPSGLSKTELYRVKGEFEMMLFFSRFNDVAKMGEHHKKAHEYLKHVSVPPRSQIYTGNLPWAVGVPSVISVYWDRSGGLDKAMEAMDECLPFYTELAGGHGAGGEILMRAEARLASGDDSGAEMLCYKTLYAAKGAGQTSNCLCAELLLARIAILRGDEKAYTVARRNIERDMAQARQTALTRLGEMCLAHLDLAFGKTDGLPEWLRHTDAIKRTLYFLTQPHAIMLHCLMLLLENRRAEFHALVESAMDTAAKMHYPLLRTHHLIFLARAKQDEGRGMEAAEHLREALAIALPDRVYLPFAEHGEALLPMLERLQKDERFDRERMEECAALSRRWSTGLAALRRALPKAEDVRETADRPIEMTEAEKLHAFAGHYDLTEKESDALSHILRKLSIAEMAGIMGISGSGVEKHITNIFGKTGVKRQRYLRHLYADWKK